MILWRRIVSAIAARAMQIGLVEDETFNVLTGGDADQTFSVRNADGALRGKRVACWVCWNLSWMVQQDHCAKALQSGAIPWPNAIRAFGWISLVLSLPYLIWRWPLVATPIIAAVLAVDVLVFHISKGKSK